MLNDINNVRVLWCTWHNNDGDKQVELPSISFLGFPNACNKLVELTFIFSWDFWMLVMNQ
jgi:hypothetical protein